MKLCYRGIRYDRSESPLEVSESNVLARYRGNLYPLRYPKHVSIAQPSPICKYRGVAYRTLADGSIGSVTAEETRTLAPVAVRVASDELQRVHAQSLCDRLTKRLEAARAMGDDALVAMLEREGHDLVCPR